MSLKETHTLGGNLSMILKDQEGDVVNSYRIKNLITNSGRRLLASFLINNNANKPIFQIAVGEGDSEQNTKNNYDAEQLIKVVDSVDADVELQPDGSASENGQKPVVLKVRATLPIRKDGPTQSINEAGILIKTDKNPAVLYNRTVFPTVNRSANMELTLIWELTF